MTDIKEALFDEEPEKREGSGEKRIRIWSLCLGRGVKNRPEKR